MMQKVDNADATSLAALNSLCIMFRIVQITIQKVYNAGAMSLAALNSLSIMFSCSDRDTESRRCWCYVLGGPYLSLHHVRNPSGRVAEAGQC